MRLIVAISENLLATSLVLAILGEWLAIGLIYLHHARRAKRPVDVNKVFSRTTNQQ